MHYDLTTRGGLWIVTNLSSGTKIGVFKTKKEARITAKLLAGWRGLVTVNGK